MLLIWLQIMSHACHPTPRISPLERNETGSTQNRKLRFCGTFQDNLNIQRYSVAEEIALRPTNYIPATKLLRCHLCTLLIRTTKHVLILSWTVGRLTLLNFCPLCNVGRRTKFNQVLHESRDCASNVLILRPLVVRITRLYHETQYIYDNNA